MKTAAILTATALAFALGACASDPNSSRSASGGASGESEIKRDAKDSLLTGKVKAALAADVGLKTWNIDVDSAGTTVTLNGVVDTESTKQRAEAVARRVDGVATVKNNLTVKGKS
ncbi:MAG TPA: BON domain-containing protein [Burkholderiales bacterium]